jgi:hypothetical protein
MNVMRIVAPLVISAVCLVIFPALGQETKATHETSVEVTEFNATYRVPVPAELEAFSTYSVPARLTVFHSGESAEKATTELTYVLPAELLGSPTSITMVSQSDGKWSGPTVEGQCAKNNTKFVCNVRYESLKPDLAALREKIRTRFPNPIEAAGRLAVAERFSTEPIGVIEYELVTGTEPTKAAYSLRVKLVGVE